MSSSKVILWGRKGCQHCEEIKSYLEEKNYLYKLIDVEGKDYLRDVLEAKYNIRHVPVIEIGTEGLFQAVLEKDFEQIEQLIEKHILPSGS